MGRLDVWKPHRHWQQNQHLLSSCFTLWCLMSSLCSLLLLVFKGGCARSWIGREEPGILAFKKLCSVCHLQIKNWDFFLLFFPSSSHFGSISNFFYMFLALFHCFVHFPGFPHCFISFHLSLSPISINYYIRYVNTREPFFSEKIWKFSHKYTKCGNHPQDAEQEGVCRLPTARPH